MAVPILRYFAYAHLPPKLQAVSKDFATLANVIDQRFADGPEKVVCLRKLLEAKDCAVRCAVDAPDSDEQPDSEPTAPSTRPSAEPRPGLNG